MSTDLWKFMNYKTPVKYYANTFIREYDLSKANINALLFRGRISKNLYDSFLNLDKKERETKIGLWIRKDRSVYEDIQKGIIYAKQCLSESNGIEDYDVVSIKNDAMFIVGKNLSNTKFYPFEFKIKNTYTVYLQLADLEIYYGDLVNPETDSIETVIDIKGVPDKTLCLHSGGMLDLICDTCYRIQRENITDTVKWLGEMYQLFLNRKLPKQFYRNFDSFSGFTVNTYTRSVSLNEIDDNMINAIDINRNLLIFRDLMSIVVDIYNRQIKR